MRQWDVVVIGAGVAGMTAARVVAAAGLSCACIDRLGPGGALINLARIHGHAEDLSGADFTAGLLDAMVAAGAELVIGEVQSLAGPPWVVATEEESHAARAVILATGLSAGTLGIAGEQDFEGRGLSHCAACDGLMFAGQRVAVSGGDKWALQEALELAAVAAHVTVLGAPASSIAAPNIAVMPGRIVALHGAAVLTGITVERDGRSEELTVDGVFSYADRRPQTGLANGLLTLDPAGGIAVDAEGRTGLPGVFAIGDVRAGASETAAEAIADGERAGLAAARHLTQHDANPD